MRRSRYAASVFLAGAALFVLAGCGRPPPPVAAATSSAAAATDTDFLARHWTRPLARQFGADASAARLASIEPAACGGCHAPQYADWQGSLHSRAMGPGVSGQLAQGANQADDPGQCTTCHAPLAEQSESLARSAAARAPSDDGLHAHGLTCAACHMRAGRVYGPPRRDGTAPPGDSTNWPHGGWTAAAPFEDSRFCAACHQFDSDGYALNGKLLENTYEEWRASPQAAQGRQCQSCHMPERRHLWRGIHDSDMVRQAVTIDVAAPVLRAGELVTDIAIANTGVGHHFPTYVTPKVFVEAYQQDRAGRMLAGTLRRYAIGRDVSGDLSREIADTRIPAGGRTVFSYRAARGAAAAALVVQLRVDPDAFYRGVYESLLASGATGDGEVRIRQALRNANASSFIADSRRVPLAL